MSGLADILSNGHVLVRDLLTGPGTPYILRKFSPLGQPDLDTDDQQRSTRGTLAGAAVQGGSTITCTYWLDAWPDDQWLTDAALLRQAWRPAAIADQSDQLNFMLAGEVWTYFGQNRDVDIHIGEDDEGDDIPEAVAEFQATDPRMFSSETVTTLTSGVPVTVVAPGSDEGIWRLTVEGPAIIPGISIDDGVNPPFVMAYGGNLDSGDTMIYSSRLRSATVNGQDKAGAMFDGAGHRAIMAQFPVGGAEVTFTLGSGSGTAQLITRGTA